MNRKSQPILNKQIIASSNVSILEYVMREPLLFGDYSNAMNDAEERHYVDLCTYENATILFTEVGRFDYHI